MALIIDVMAAAIQSVFWEKVVGWGKINHNKYKKLDTNSFPPT